MQVLWWILLVISAVVVIFVTGFALPKLFFKHFPLTATRDRGLKKYKDKNGVSVVYQPAAEYKKYITQYILSKRQGKNVIICKVADNIRHLKCEVVLFDALTKAFDVIDICEHIAGGLTKTVELPQGAAYASLIVREANGTPVQGITNKGVSAVNLVFYCVFTAIIVLCEVFLIRLFLAKLFSGVFFDSILSSLVNNAIAVIIGLLISLIIVVTVLIFIKLSRFINIKSLSQSNQNKKLSQFKQNRSR